MAKRELPPATAISPGDEPKPKRRSSKKHGTPAPTPAPVPAPAPAPVLSQETASLQAALERAAVKPPGLSNTPAKRRSRAKTPIKIEPQDGDAAFVPDELKKSSQASKSGRVKGKDKDKTVRKKSIKATTTPPLQVNVGPSTGPVETGTAADIVNFASGVEHRESRQSAKVTAIIDIESSDDDGVEAGEEDEDEDYDEDDDGEDGEDDVDDGGEDNDEDGGEEDGERKPAQDEKPQSSDREVLIVTGQLPKNVPPPPPQSGNDNAVSTLQDCSDEEGIYLDALARLPLSSPVVQSALQEMMFKWLHREFEIDAIPLACRESRVARQLVARGATHARLDELSKLLAVADPLEHFAWWVKRKVGNPEKLRKLQALLEPSALSQRDECQKAAPVLTSAVSGTSHPLPSRPVPHVHHQWISNVSADYNVSRPSQRRDGRDSYTPRALTPPHDGLSPASRAGTTRSQRSSGRGRADGQRSRGHDTGRSYATTVPYVRQYGVHKVLLFIVGTPDTALLDTDFDAHDFHSACENAFGAEYVDAVGRYSENTWNVRFKALLPAFFSTPVRYLHNTIYPDEAFRSSPSKFVSDFSGLDVENSAIYESVAAIFGTRPGTMHRLEQGEKRYIIVLFKYAPDLMRFFAPLPCGTTGEFMPAFRPHHHGGNRCSLCHTQHGKIICPDAKPLT